MPVQDEEKIPITEEMDETHKSEAIMPVINAIYDIYSDRIDDLQKDKRDDLVNAIESMQSFAESPYISQELRDMTLLNIENSKKELEAVASALAAFITPIDKEQASKQAWRELGDAYVEAYEERKMATEKLKAQLMTGKLMKKLQ